MEISAPGRLSLDGPFGMSTKKLSRVQGNTILCKQGTILYILGFKFVRPGPGESRAVKVGDRIEARLGSVLFVLSEFNFSRLPSSRFLRYRRSPILFTYHGELLFLFLVISFCSVFENPTTKIVSALTCHASPYARIERTQDKSPGRHSCSAERGERVRSCGYYRRPRYVFPRRGIPTDTVLTCFCRGYAVPRGLLSREI
jgi:hypothetical protein